MRLRNDFVEIGQLNPQGGSPFLAESSCNSMSMVRRLLSGAFAVAEGSTICPQIVRLIEHFATCVEPTLQHPVKLVWANTALTGLLLTGGGEVVLTSSLVAANDSSFVVTQEAL